MKAEHRHELHSNVLADWIEETADKIKPYARAITGVCVAAAILLCVYWYVTSREQGSVLAASDQLILALQRNESPEDLQVTISDYRGTQQAQLAQLLMAEQLLNLGNNAMFTDKRKGRDDILRARDHFRAIDEATRDPLLGSWSLYGLGRAYESLGELDQAREQYQVVLKQYPDSTLAADVRAHLKALDSQPTKEFYEWFAKQDPRPAPSTSTPGVKPSFDLKEPRMPDDVKLPSAVESGREGSSSMPGQDSGPQGEK